MLLCSCEDTRKTVYSMNNENKYFFLTEKNIDSLIGKKVEFRAPSYEYNRPYYGIAIIKAVDYKKKKPIECESISGDDLKFAFLDNHGLSTKDGGETYQMIDKPRCFSYSDGDREVAVRICE